MIPAEKIEKITFKKFVTTIGNLPSSYVESLSYYECILWLCNYLQTTVIPAINNNGEAVEELQNLFIELKSYVDNYLSDEHLQPLVDQAIQDMLAEGNLYMSLKKLYNESTKELEFVVEGIPSIDLLERLATLATPEGDE